MEALSHALDIFAHAALSSPAREELLRSCDRSLAAARWFRKTDEGQGRWSASFMCLMWLRLFLAPTVVPVLSPPATDVGIKRRSARTTRAENADGPYPKLADEFGGRTWSGSGPSLQGSARAKAAPRSCKSLWTGERSIYSGKNTGCRKRQHHQTTVWGPRITGRRVIVLGSDGAAIANISQRRGGGHSSLLARDEHFESYLRGPKAPWPRFGRDEEVGVTLGSNVGRRAAPSACVVESAPPFELDRINPIGRAARRPYQDGTGSTT